MNIVAVGCFFVIAWLLGLTLIRKLKLKFNFITSLAVSGIVGIISLTQILFWQSWFVPFKAESILISLSLLTGGLVLWWSQQIKKIGKIEIKVNKKKLKSWGLFLLVWLGLFLLIWSHMLKREADGVYAGWVNIWGDWAAHLTYTTSFGWGNNLPPVMPILAKAKFSYPFMADFLSAILLKLQGNIFVAMLWPSLILSMLLVIVITALGQEISKNSRVGKLTTTLFLFNGGLGFWWWLKDIKTLGLGAVTRDLPQEYTHLEKLANIEWINIITSQVVPQRGFLLGFPAAVLVYLLLWRYWNQRQSKNLLAAGLLTTMLPLIHAHSVAVIGAVSVILFGIELIQTKKKVSVVKNWLKFFLPIGLLGLPQMMYFYSGSLTTGSFIHWLPGWLSIKRGDSIYWFWVKNLGLMIIWILLGLKTATKKLRWFSFPFWLVLLAANFWLFQPWEWDNTKFFVHWYLIACVLGAQVLIRGLSEKRRLVQGLTLIGLIITIWAGVLDAWRLTQYQYRKIRFWDNTQLKLASWVRQNTPPEAVFLTADNHDHWLPTISGRKTVLGFKGWLWTYGIDYSNQEEAVRDMFDGKKLSKDKLKEYGVNYIVIGPAERDLQPAVNEDFFDLNYPVVYQLENTKIYSVTD